MHEYYKIIKKNLFDTSYYLVKQNDDGLEVFQYYDDNKRIKTDLMKAHLIKRCLIIGEEYKQISTEFKDMQEVINHLNKYPQWEKTPYYVRIHSKANETIKFKYLFFLNSKTHLPVLNPMIPDTDGFSVDDIRNLIMWLTTQENALPISAKIILMGTLNYTDENLFNAWKIDSI